jgi:hypothetical protein
MVPIIAAALAIIVLAQRAIPMQWRQAPIAALTAWGVYARQDVGMRVLVLAILVVWEERLA